MALKGRLSLPGTAAALLLLAACTVTSSIVPPGLEDRIDRDLTLSTVRSDPEAYRGRLMLLGGRVLQAARLEDGTHLEVQHLPLDQGQLPVAESDRSEGRFVAIQPSFLDPATVPPGTWVTMVAEVTGNVRRGPGDSQEPVPVLQIKFLKRWTEHPRIVPNPLAYLPGRLGYGWGRFSYYPYYW